MAFRHSVTLYSSFFIVNTRCVLDDSFNMLTYLV